MMTYKQFIIGVVLSQLMIVLLMFWGLWRFQQLISCKETVGDHVGDFAGDKLGGVIDGLIRKKGG